MQRHVHLPGPGGQPPFPGKSSSVKRFVRKLRGLMPLETGLMFPATIGENRLARRFMARQSAFNWMRKVLQGEFTPTLLCNEIGSLPGLDKLLTTVTEGRLSDRNRALAVLARNKELSLSDVCGFLAVSKEAVLKYCRCYHAGGFELLMSRKAHALPSSTRSKISRLFFPCCTPRHLLMESIGRRGEWSIFTPF